MNNETIISNINHIQILIDILLRKYDIYIKQLDNHINNKTINDNKYINYVKILYENFMIFLFDINYYLKNNNIDNNIDLDEYTELIDNQYNIFIIYVKYDKKINFINNNTYDNVLNNININNYKTYYLLFTFILSKIDDIFNYYKDNIILEDIIIFYHIIILYITSIDNNSDKYIFNKNIDIDKLLDNISFFKQFDKYSPIINIIKNITCFLYFTQE